MKNIIALAAISAALAAPLAQAEGAYAGANIGRAEQKATFEGLSFKENSTGFKLYGGFDFTKNYGVEGGYVDLRSADGSGNGAAVSSKPQAIYLAATGTLPLNEQFSLFGKLGVSFNHTKISAEAPGFSDSISDNQTTPYIGVGASFALDKKISFVAEYENFGKMAKDGSNNVKGDLLSVGVRFQF